jgi:hypothetical protein
VFKKVEKQLPQLTTLDLQYVSPSLLKARNLELAVPGNDQCTEDFFILLTRCNQALIKVDGQSSKSRASPQSLPSLLRNNVLAAFVSKAVTAEITNMC